ncbi:MAG: PAS domain-containing protein [Alphaproteobacteria bacterium]|nr:PAS domain-containing protein [Alphaproteobacteria bacterium]
MPDDINTNSLLIKAAPLRCLYRDWDARRAGRRFPARADFDPVALRYILGNLSLVDVLRDPLRFIFRLHASQNAAHLGADLTGKELAAMPAWTDPAGVRTQYEAVIASGAPQVRRRVGTHANGGKWAYEVLVLPLSAGGDTIDMLMAGMSWTAL